MRGKRPGWRSVERTYQHLSRGLAEAAYRERTAPLRAAMTLGAQELRAIHSASHPECLDQGPETCPTWEAIHALEKGVR
jgi:hypothetical protein